VLILKNDVLKIIKMKKLILIFFIILTNVSLNVMAHTEAPKPPCYLPDKPISIIEPRTDKKLHNVITMPSVGVMKIEACIAKEININEIFINYEKPKNGSYKIKDGHFTLLIFMHIIKKENEKINISVIEKNGTFHNFDLFIKIKK